MSFTSLTIPDDPALWASWLEQQLVGLHLAECVEELQVLHGIPDSPELTLNQVCGEQLPLIFRSGLSQLHPQQLRQLLRTPRLLLELQEQVLEHGGSYWSQLPLDTEMQVALKTSWEKISSSLSVDSTVELQQSRRRVLFVWGSIAASILFAMLWFWPRSNSQWGFDRPGAFTAQLNAPAYCHHLAQIVEDDWTPNRFSDRAMLKRSLQEFIHGCDTLLAAEHPQFSDSADRQWLKERCQKWRGKLNAALADLNADKRPFADIRDEANATVQTLINVLRKRAEELS